MLTHKLHVWCRFGLNRFSGLDACNPAPAQSAASHSPNPSSAYGLAFPPPFHTIVLERPARPAVSRLTASYLRLLVVTAYDLALTSSPIPITFNT